MNWTLDSLKEFLDRRDIPRNAYSFYANEDECYCLEELGNEWLVYYSERGNKNELGWGKTEAQALNILKLYLLEAFGKI